MLFITHDLELASAHLRPGGRHVRGPGHGGAADGDRSSPPAASVHGRPARGATHDSTRAHERLEVDSRPAAHARSRRLPGCPFHPRCAFAQAALRRRNAAAPPTRPAASSACRARRRSATELRPMALAGRGVIAMAEPVLLAVGELTRRSARASAALRAGRTERARRPRRVVPSSSAVTAPRDRRRVWLGQDDDRADARRSRAADRRADPARRRSELAARPRRRERATRGRAIQIVFQDPYTSLDPHQSVRRLARRGPARAFLAGRGRARRADPRAARRRRAGRTEARTLPRELSGGQRQRAAIARALAAEPHDPDPRRGRLRARRLDPGPDP